MTVQSTILAAVAGMSMALPVLADDISILDAYARSSGANAKSGAAFFVVHNRSAESDRLIDVSSDIAARTELHTHKEDGNGIMKMMHVPEGFEVPAEGHLVLERGGHHVMLMGLQEPMKDGGKIAVVLTFEKAGDMLVDIPVDQSRQTRTGNAEPARHRRLIPRRGPSGRTARHVPFSYTEPQTPIPEPVASRCQAGIHQNRRSQPIVQA